MNFALSYRPGAAASLIGRYSANEQIEPDEQIASAGKDELPRILGKRFETILEALHRRPDAEEQAGLLQLENRIHTRLENLAIARQFKEGNPKAELIEKYDLLKAHLDIGDIEAVSKALRKMQIDPFVSKLVFKELTTGLVLYAAEMRNTEIVKDLLEFLNTNDDTGQKVSAEFTFGNLIEMKDFMEFPSKLLQGEYGLEGSVQEALLDLLPKDLILSNLWKIINCREVDRKSPEAISQKQVFDKLITLVKDEQQIIDNLYVAYACNRAANKLLGETLERYASEQLRQQFPLEETN